MHLGPGLTAPSLIPWLDLRGRFATQGKGKRREEVKGRGKKKGGRKLPRNTFLNFWEVLYLIDGFCYLSPSLQRRSS